VLDVPVLDRSGVLLGVREEHRVGREQDDVLDAGVSRRVGEGHCVGGVGVEEHLAHPRQEVRERLGIAQVGPDHLDRVGEVGALGVAAGGTHRLSGAEQLVEHRPADVAAGTDHQDGHGSPR
jgi:hypothetical protein